MKYLVLILILSASAVGQWTISTPSGTPPSANCNDPGVYCAADCSFAEVSAKVNEAAGAVGNAPATDTVVLPICPNVDPADNSEGNVWTERLVISKRINLVGAGVNQTVLIDNRTPNSNQAFIQMLTGDSLTDTGMFRVSNFTLQSNGQIGTGGALLTISTGSHAVRVDHLWAKNIGNFGAADFAVIFNNSAIGVFDHNLLTGAWGGGFPQIRHQAWLGVGANGDNSWAQPLNLGTQEFGMYAEDNFNVILSSSGVNITCTVGGRCSFRHNYLPGVGGVSTEGRDRGKRFQEIYENLIQCNSANNNQTSIATMKGGSGIVWGNYVRTVPVSFTLPNGQVFDSPNTTGPSPSSCYGGRSGPGALQLMNYRVWRENMRPWGRCAGTAPWDNNDTEGGPNHDGLWDTGTVATGSTASRLDDSTKAWTPNQWQGYIASIVQASPLWDGDTGKTARINSNTETSLNTDSLSTGNWPEGSTYQIRRVYDCMDSLGRGRSAYISGALGTAPAGGVTCQAPPTSGTPACAEGTGSRSWINNTTEPVYLWSNMKTFLNQSGLSQTEPYRFGRVISLAGAPNLNWWLTTEAPTYAAYTSNNRDVYEQVPDGTDNIAGTFDGTIGVGVGPVASRPATCTPNPRWHPGGPDIPGVGWWDPNTRTLSVCGSPNHWIENYYKPFTYPHPLRAVATISKNGHLIETGEDAKLARPLRHRSGWRRKAARRK